MASVNGSVRSIGAVAGTWVTQHRVVVLPRGEHRRAVTLSVLDTGDFTLVSAVQIRWSGSPPFCLQHINMTGDYLWDVESVPEPGDFRDLGEPGDPKADDRAAAEVALQATASARCR